MIASDAGILHANNLRSVWDSRRLWSLWEMIEFQLGELAAALGMLGTAGHTLALVPNMTFHKDDDERIIAAIQLVMKRTIELDMPVTYQAVTDLNKMWNSYGDRKDNKMVLTERTEIQRLAVEMKNTLDFGTRELTGRTFLMLSKREVDLLTDKLPFGEDVINQFVLFTRRYRGSKQMLSSGAIDSMRVPP